MRSLLLSLVLGAGLAGLCIGGVLWMVRGGGNLVYQTKIMEANMTIYEIKQRTVQTSPYFFSRKTMGFFGQTLKDFSVTKQDDGKYRVCAPVRVERQKSTGRVWTKRFFNPGNNELERE